MATLSLDNLTKVYRPRGREPVLAVDHVSLEVGDGEIVGLLGSSGCGKTSTLRMIAGFEEATEGKIRSNGREIQDLPPSQRDVAMAFEGYALYPPLRLRDNIGFALLRGRRPRNEIDQRVAEVAGLLEIEDISTAIQLDLRRAAAAPAWPVPDPPRPFAAGRAHVAARAQLRADPRAPIRLSIQNRMTTIFVTHDQTEAIALADRIAVMEKGVLGNMRHR